MDKDEKIRIENSIILGPFKAVREVDDAISRLSQACCLVLPNVTTKTQLSNAQAHAHNAWTEIRAAQTHIEMLLHMVEEME